MSLETISISTSKYITTVNAKIDGHVYSVHKMGAGTQLDFSRLMTKLARMRTDILNAQALVAKAKDDGEADKLIEKFGGTMEEFRNLVVEIENIFVEIFDDREDGKKSQKLVHTLGIDNIQKVYAEIFDKAEENADK